MQLKCSVGRMAHQAERLWQVIILPLRLYCVAIYLFLHLKKQTKVRLSAAEGRYALQLHIHLLSPFLSFERAVVPDMAQHSRAAFAER